MPDASEAVVSVNQLNGLVLDYLVVNGFSSLAETFAADAGLPPVDTDDIAGRQQFKEYMLAGRIEDAIAELQNLDPWFLDSRANDHYELLQLQLIELIRGADMAKDINTIQPALEFAESRILALLEQDESSSGAKSKLLDRFKEVVGLICFESDELPAKLRELMSVERRAVVAEQINRSYLEFHRNDGVSKLERILVLNAWGQNELRQAGLLTQELEHDESEAAAA